jgi:nucleoside-diphosphate-sugar epimerase
LTRRAIRRQRSYPGLVELFSAFYRSITGAAEPPMSPTSILETVRICETIATRLAEAHARSRASSGLVSESGGGVLVTGGTGFLGSRVVRTLAEQGWAVRCVARREPPPWQRVSGVEYVTADLASGSDPALFRGIGTVIHCAAATAGGWSEHQRYSLDATEHMVRGAAKAGVARFLHVSSTAVLGHSGGPTRDEDPLHADSRSSGPYVWGKLESERLAVALGRELGVSVKVVRPGAIVDYGDFDPPGRLGKRVGGVFVAVGAPSHRLATTELGFAAQALEWMVRHWEEVAPATNLLDPLSPTKRDLLKALRATNPDLTVVWLPTIALVPMSWAALVLQKVLRPRRPATNVAKVFAPQAFDTARSAGIAERLAGPSRPTDPAYPA